MGQLTLVRGVGGVGSFGRLIATMDDRHVGELFAGSRVVVEVSAGRHRVRARMDWARNRELSVEVSDTEGAARSRSPTRSFQD